jgi:acetyl esterase/lipase
LHASNLDWHPFTERIVIMRRRLLCSVVAIIVVMGVPQRGSASPAPQVEKDIVYGKAASGDELKLDLVRPVGIEAPAPLILWLHGGAWRAGDRKDNHEAMLGLANLGYAGASIQYRLAPRHKFPAQIDDVRMALAFLRANAKEYHINSDRIGVVGGSAGGHLALLLGLAKDRDGKASGVRAVVSMAGPTDLRTLRVNDEANAGFRKLLGRDLDGLLEDLLGTADRSARVWAEASPITHVDKSNPPVLTIHGSADIHVPVQQAKDLHLALKKAGVTEKLVILDGASHDFGSLTGEQKLTMMREMLEFLDQNVRKKR